jgi:hypothetical protein
VRTPRTVLPGALALVLSPSAPTVLAPRAAVPGALALTLTGVAPSVLTPRTSRPGAASLTLTFAAPTVTAGTGTTVVPGPLGLRLTGLAPFVAGSDAGGRGGRVRAPVYLSLIPDDDEVMLLLPFEDF